MSSMITPSIYDKSDICQFFYWDLFHIVNTVYVRNFMLNGQKLLSPHPALRFSKKPSPGTVKPSFYIYLRYQQWYLRYSFGLPLLNPMRRCSFYAGVNALVTYQFSWTEVGWVIKHRMALFFSCCPDKSKTSRG